LVAALGNLLSGRQVTGPAESRIDLEGTGSAYIDRDVVVDGYLVTARSVSDAQQFCQVLLDRLQTIGGIAA
jgi:putative intracellular protease/amidase